MKLNGTFMIREIADEVLAIPIGETALTLNEMIVLNSVSKVIWECLEKDTSEEEILLAVTEKFEVDVEEAREDIAEILAELFRQKLIIP